MDSLGLKQSVQQQFDRVARHYLHDSPMAEAGLLDLIITSAAPRPEHLSLDIACGAGLLVCRFAPLVTKATGIDMSRSMLAAAEQEARRQEATNTFFQLGDSEALPFADNSFDIVTCKLALHYFPNPDIAVGEMKRVAKPGGRIVLVDRVAAEDRQKRELHNRIEKLRTPSKVKVYSTSEISSLLEGAGLAVQAVHQYEQYQDVDDWLLTTGASSFSQNLARNLIRESFDEDTAGLRLKRSDAGLTITHTTGIFIAEER